MKLIIKEYLSSLRERGELDAILPDLLSQMGLNVFSRPGRGTRQDGVDVGAVGSLNGGSEKVYLLAIKPGDLTRAGWDSEVQSVRPSLNEILDAYIPNRLPNEHRGKDIVICICCGGDILEAVREQVEGFFQRNTKDNITFEEWNGDRLASYIESSFLREDLLPEAERSHLRKSLAMIQEPDTSYMHFAELMRSLSTGDRLTEKKLLTVLRQMSLCLWVLFAWSRREANLESALRSAELTVLSAWNVFRSNADRSKKAPNQIESAFVSVVSVYRQISAAFLAENVMPWVKNMHALSAAVHGSCSVDINLKLFDLLGRLALDGLWASWLAQRCPPEAIDQKEEALQSACSLAEAIKDLIVNNPSLLLPIKDDQSIDISLAVLLLAIDRNNCDDIKNWLSGTLERARFAYRSHGPYPCILHSYSELLTHPKRGDDEYRKRVTAGSVLFPLVALWAALLKDDRTYSAVAEMRGRDLQHCNFQFWYPDESSEQHLYINDAPHGAVLSHVCVDRSKEDLLSQVFGECDQAPHFRELSAVKLGWWPLVAVACRHHRLPPPVELLRVITTDPSLASKVSPVSLAGEPKVDLAQAHAHGLTDDEFRLIEKLLGRTPTFTELGVFSVMWSEHCSYKSSRRHLKTLPSHGDLVAVGEGENAGAVDVGDGWLAVFKIESHNHPSYVEPYQGAATGVGGILRDIFTMGARPVANMDSLKFGSFDHPRTRYLLGGVVGGIGGYGNCVGVPTVAGETMFDAAYNGNILVNAFSLGLARKGELQSAHAKGVGNPVLYVGSATGRDGIHGASLLASAEFDATSEAKRPTVQVGDPFEEKLLIEACLEAAKTGAVVAIQDMGAAGLTSSSSEMAARGGLGIEIDLDKVPLREATLTPYEILLSESQERMLIVAARGREAELQKVFEKWDLHAVVIGTITDDARWRATWRGEVVADIPVRALADEAPMYDRPAVAPKSPPARPAPIKSHPEPARALRELLGNPNVGSKKWIYRQYDSLVLSNTILGPGSDAAVLRIKGTKRGLAMKVDSNPRACALDPYLGAVATVVEAVRNVACAGAHPAGITNCLNYGNPERPEIMWQFTRGIAALRDASIAFKAPVISGNVSFYNETEGRAIPPTPTIAVVGTIDDVSKRVTQFFKAPGDYILMVRTAKPSLAASEYEAMYGSSPEGLSPIDIARESRLIEALLGAIEAGLIRSTHDVAEGGLGVALAEACFNPDKLLGAHIDGLSTSDAAELFGEGPSTIVISASENDVAPIRRSFETSGIECRTIGRVTENPQLTISGASIDDDVNVLNRIYESALPGRL